MAVGDIIRVSIEGLMQGVTTINTLHWRVNTVGTGQAESVLAAELDTRIGAELVPLWVDEFTYVRTVAQKIYPAPTGRAFFDATSTDPGGNSTTPLPQEVAYTITHRTAFAGPKYRGRNFVSGLGINDNDGGNLDATRLNLWQAAWEIVLDVVSDSGYVFYHVLWHRSDNTYDLVTDSAVRSVLRVQRRRQTDRGI